MKRSLTNAEYVGWVSYYSACPFGHEIEDYQNAILAALLAHSKDIDTFRMCKPPPKPKTEKQLCDMLVNYFSSIGGNV